MDEKEEGHRSSLMAWVKHSENEYELFDGDIASYGRVKKDQEGHGWNVWISNVDTVEAGKKLIEQAWAVRQRGELHEILADVEGEMKQRESMSMLDDVIVGIKMILSEAELATSGKLNVPQFDSVSLAGNYLLEKFVESKKKRGEI